MDTDENHHFELELNNVFRSLAGYSTNENGEKQLRFDPPVYTQRYSTVLNILSHERWKDEIKKVARRWRAAHQSLNQLIFHLFHYATGRWIRMCRYESGGFDATHWKHRAHRTGENRSVFVRKFIVDFGCQCGIVMATYGEFWKRHWQHVRDRLAVMRANLEVRCETYTIVYDTFIQQHCRLCWDKWHHRFSPFSRLI